MEGGSANGQRISKLKSLKHRTNIEATHTERKHGTVSVSDHTSETTNSVRDGEMKKDGLPRSQTVTFVQKHREKNGMKERSA